MANRQRRGVLVAAASVAALAAAVALSACGGSGSVAEPASAAGPGLGRNIRLTNCTDWQRGDVGERLGTIRQIRSFAGGPVGTGGGHGATLSDEYAYDLFERFCAREYARGYKLYKLYTRAAAFGGPAP